MCKLFDPTTAHILEPGVDFKKKIGKYLFRCIYKHFSQSIICKNVRVKTT